MFNVFGEIAKGVSDHLINGYTKKNDPSHSPRGMFPNRNFWGDYIRQRNEASERESESYETSNTVVVENGGNVVSVTIINSVHIID